MPQAQYLLGLDFGTDSVRAVVVDAASGKEAANQVARYRRWTQGLYCDPTRNRFRQHPQDYLDGLEEAVRGALGQLPKGAGQRVVGIGIDTTGSTPCAVDRAGTPLALLPEFRENPNAMFVLWKDHSGGAGGRGNQPGRPHLGRHGFHEVRRRHLLLRVVLRQDPACPARRTPAVAEAAFSWVEHCDWMPALLTGATDPAHPEAQPLRRRPQGHVARRVGRAAAGGIPGPAGPPACRACAPACTRTPSPPT